MFGPTIYKRDANGGIRVWHYEVEGTQWRTHSGLLDGQNVVTGWTSCTPKSRETAEEQALFEAQAEMKKKLDRDYRATIEDVDVPRASVIKPMLAHKYEGWTGPCWSQPKLDGVRCIATKDGLWSRQGKPIVSCPHVAETLAGLFAAKPHLILDGELYNHDLRDDLPRISGIVRSTKPSAEDLAEAARLIQYHIYDAPSTQGPFPIRAQDVFAVPASDILHRVVAIHCETEAQLDSWYGSYLEAGYEGQIVRLAGPYEQKRSKLLLKRKEFVDDEFQVVRIEEGNGNWAGYAKRAVCLLPDGREFGAGIKGNQDYCRKLLRQAPTSATIRYFKPTPDGVPFLPVAVAFHDGERL